jgi:hypothetical protein
VDHVNSVQCKYERKEGIQFNFLHSTSDWILLLFCGFKWNII